jgi:hypothetical protein
MCIPKPNDPSIFGTILDRAAGSFRLAPVDSAVPAHRQYVPGTMVLATTWQTRSGWLIVNDFLAVAPWYRTGERSEHHRRTPGDFDAKHVLIRTATCLHGSVDILLNCEPSFDYGRVDAEWEYDGSTYETVRTTNPDFPASDLDRRHAIWHRGASGPRSPPSHRGRDVLRGASVGPKLPLHQSSRSRHLSRRDEPLLARLDRRRPLSPTTRGASTSSAAPSP